MDDGFLSEWIGRTEVEKDEAAVPLMRRVAALLDSQQDLQPNSGVVPQGWHLAFFPSLAPQGELAEDGHPRKGAFLPPVPLPRRLFAGRRIHFYAPIALGSDLTRTSVIKKITPKEGRAGPIVIVEVEHVVETDGVRAIQEVHSIVYRPAAKRPEDAVQEPLPQADQFRESDLSEAFNATPSLLFRYSAVTFNAHRIHYDLRYATEIEGYPELVVNAGLIAIKLCELAKRRLQGAALKSFEIRHKRPFYANGAGSIHCRSNSVGQLQLWALDERGLVTAEGTVESAMAESPKMSLETVTAAPRTR